MIIVDRPEAGFEPATEDPQSHMLPGYTTRAISFYGAITEKYLKYVHYKRDKLK